MSVNTWREFFRKIFKFRAPRLKIVGEHTQLVIWREGGKFLEYTYSQTSTILDIDSLEIYTVVHPYQYKWHFGLNETYSRLQHKLMKRFMKYLQAKAKKGFKKIFQKLLAFGNVLSNIFRDPKASVSQSVLSSTYNILSFLLTYINERKWAKNTYCIWCTVLVFIWTNRIKCKDSLL